jgi:hypothetical protein
MASVKKLSVIKINSHADFPFSNFSQEWGKIIVVINFAAKTFPHDLRVGSTLLQFEELKTLEFSSTNHHNQLGIDEDEPRPERSKDGY